MAEQGPQQLPISEAMRLAVDHHQAGRLQQAEAIYQAILQSEPTHAGASYNLALVALQSGRSEQGVPVFRSAVQTDPDNAAHWMNYAVALAGSGDPTAARQVLLRARERGLGGSTLESLLAQVERMSRSSQPTVIETVDEEDTSGTRAINLSPLLRLYQAGHYAEVEAQAHRLLPDFPDSAPLARLLGASLLAQQKFGPAHEVLSLASERNSDDALILYLLGLSLRRLGRNEDARDAFIRSLAIAPESMDALLNASANALTLGDADEARRYAEQALALQPEAVDALRVLADAEAAAGNNAEAAELYRRAIGMDPGQADLYTNLGDALINLGRADEATEEIQRALQLRPGDAPAHVSMGRALYQLGETRAALEHFRTASANAPERAEMHTAYLFCLAHEESVSPDQCFEEHVRFGDLIESPLRPTWPTHDNDRDPQRGLRVGFVSADLRDHAVAYLIEPIWRAMKGGRHTIHAYANMPIEDAVSARLRALTDDWVPVARMDDEKLCARIRADRIDILFDLSGHTTRNRLAVFARKPAPIQVSWIGYPGTTGLSAMDYRFMRGTPAKAAELQPFFREKLVNFRFRGFEPEPNAPAVNALPALTAGHVTFGSFNRTSKIGSQTIDVWSRVMRAIPDSTLLIAAAGEARTQERLRAAFEEKGIDPGRLTFRPRLSMQAYLAMHHEVDIALDTLPYTGGTTTSHALWMGVPVLTLTGLPLQQRQGAGFLEMLGMSEWAVNSDSAFVEQARAAVSDLDELNRLRLGLREKITRFLQESSVDAGRELDVALQTMWQRWCAGLAPENFSVTV